MGKACEELSSHVKRIWRRGLLLYMSFHFVSFCSQRCFATFWTTKNKARHTLLQRKCDAHQECSRADSLDVIDWAMNIQWKCHERNRAIDVLEQHLFYPNLGPYFSILDSQSSLLEPRWTSVYLSLNECNDRNKSRTSLTTNANVSWVFSKHVDIMYDKKPSNPWHRSITSGGVLFGMQWMQDTMGLIRTH